MHLFFTPSTEHLAKHINIVRDHYIYKTFSDGEQYVRIPGEIEGEAWVVASTNPPAENLLTLFFLLDALNRKTDEINLLIPYFAYARQNRITEKGECLSAKVISAILSLFKLKKVVVVHMHSRRMREYLDYEDIVPVQLVSSISKSMEVIVAPDKGGIPFAEKVGKECGLPVIYLEKERITDKKVRIEGISGKVKGRKAIIVDDMITTGGTIIKATEELLAEGAKEINVYATHGIFSENAAERLIKLPIEKIHVSNSLPQSEAYGFEIIDISSLIQKRIEQN